MAAIVKWADYSGGFPGGAALRTAGFTGAIRYVGLGSGGKRITAAEYRDLVANGIQVLLVAELNTHDAEGGYAAGVSNARAALADARALGIPDSVGIAAACDEHLNSAQIGTCVDYVRGFRDVLGANRTGAYGFAEFVDAVHAQGFAGWWWKCGSAPALGEAAWVTFWQRNSGQTTQTVNRVTVDIDDQTNTITEDDLLPDERAALFTIRDQITGGVNPDGTLKGWGGLPVYDPTKHSSTAVDLLNYIAHQLADPAPSRAKGSAVTIPSLRDAILDTNGAAFDTKASTADGLAAIGGAVAKLPTSLPGLTDAQVSTICQAVSTAVVAAAQANSAATPQQIAAVTLATLGAALQPKAA